MSEVLDDEHQIPWRHQLRTWAELKRLETWFEGYQAEAVALMDAGVTFGDLFGTGLGSDAALEANGTFFDSGTNTFHQWSDWCDIDHRFFPYAMPFGEDMLSVLYKLWYPTEPVEPSEEKWGAMLFFSLLPGESRSKFYIGWLQRTMVRYVQVRIARQLRNIFCLDNRGRPLDV